MSEAGAKLPEALTGTRSAGLADLAGAIASNLTQSREGNLAPPGEQPREEPERDEAAPATDDSPEPTETREAPAEASPEEPAADGEVPDAAEDVEQGSDRYSIEDFADAAGATGEDFESRLFVTVKGPDGAPREVSVSELRNGYRWNAANTKRAQEIAEQRTALQAKFTELATIQEQADAVIASQFEALDSAEKTLDEQIAATDWAALQQRGDGSYADARAYAESQRQQIQRERDRLTAAKQGVADSRAKGHEHYMAEVLPKAREQLLEMIPEWSDDSRRAEEGAALSRYAQELGFTREEYDACIDPRMFRLLRLAWQGQKRAAEGSAAAKQVAKAPKMKVQPGRRRSQQERQTSDREALVSRAVSTGKTRDLAAVVLNNMQRQR